MSAATSGARLTKRLVDQSYPRTTRYFIWDSELKGFGIQIEPTGTKSYIVRYRPKGLGRDGKKQFSRLGRHGEITADQARDMAKALLGRVAAGFDPALERQLQRSEQLNSRADLTVKDLGELFMSDHAFAKRKHRTALEYQGILNRHVFPRLGAIKARDLKRADLAKLHLEMRETAPTANRMLSVVSSMFTFAKRRELIPEGKNPTRGIEQYREEGRERYLSSDEIRRIGEALHEGETKGIPWQIDYASSTSKHAPKQWKNRRETLDLYAVAAIRLLLLTGARLREILDLRWEYVDFDRGLLHLPDSKTGRKIIVLSSASEAILKNLLALEEPSYSGNGYVIKGKFPNKPRVDLKKPWNTIRRYTNLHDVRIHDLRHTFASIGAGSSLGLQVVGKLLGHSQPQTTARYAHLDADPLRRATNLISEQIISALGKQDSNGQ